MEFSKIATDMNTKIENDEQMTVDVEIETKDGKIEVVTCAIIIVLTVKARIISFFSLSMRMARTTTEMYGSMNL